MLTAKLHQVPGVKMSRAVPQLPRYALVLWIGIIVPLTLPVPLPFKI